MRYKPSLDPSRLYVAGRAGELVDYTNPLTFSLVQKIHGPHGPLRSELHLFGLANTTYPDNHLINVYGRIYSDLTIENRVLWHPAGYNAELVNDAVVVRTRIFNPLFPQSLWGFIAKMISDIKFQTNPIQLDKKISQRYAQFSKTSRTAILNHHLTIGQFLNLYRDITYISFIYETLKHINDPHDEHSQNPEVHQYIMQNDHFINDSDKKYEHSFVKLGFTLGHYQAIHTDSDQFTPDTLPSLKSVPANIGLLAKLQCMKNNMRLRTYPMLYELNKQLRAIADMHKLNQYGYLTLDELLTVEDSPQYYQLTIEDRQAYYEAGKKMKLPTVIRNGVIEEASLPAVELTHYQGIGCSPGKTIGILGEIRDPNLAVVSEINIFPNASPEYTPHFKQSRGIIFETGSPLAHGAIVARELKIPAIILSIDFRSLIGKQVTIDGTQGTVTVVE